MLLCNYFYNQNSGNLESWYCCFVLEEIGGLLCNVNWFLENLWLFNVGVCGQIGDSGWDYEVVYSCLCYENCICCLVLLVGINEYLLGLKLGVCNGVEVYVLDLVCLFKFLILNEYEGLFGYQESCNVVWLQIFSVSVNGCLFVLLGGDVVLVVVVEVGSQGYCNCLDSWLGIGEFWNISVGIGVGGDCDCYVVGVELQLLLL